jgi:flagellar motor switch protein FliG
LRREFVGDASRARGPDSAAVLAAVLNHAEKATVDQVIAGLEAEDPQASARVRRLMFTFEDLTRVDRATFGMLIAECAADRLPIALSAASQTLRDLFLSSMSERAGNMLREEIENLPTQRKRVVEEAQAEIVVLAKRLAEEGRIFILEGDEMEEANG